MKKVFVVAAVAALGLIACNKSDLVNTGSPVSQNAPKNILRFDSYEALSLAIDRSMLPAAMKAPGQGTANGFLSFGDLADMAYEEVAQYQDDYKSVEEVRAAVAQHSDYLQIIQDENGEYSVETKLYESPTRYIVNEDLMYQVKDTLVKTLEEYTILTPEKNYTELLKVDEANIIDYQDNPEFLVIENPRISPIEPVPTPQTNLGTFIRCEQIKRIDGRDHRLRCDFLFDDSNINGMLFFLRPAFDITYKRKDILNWFYWTFKCDITYDLTVTLYNMPDMPANQQFKKTGSAYAWRIQGLFYDTMFPTNRPHPGFSTTRGLVKANGLSIKCDRG